jgi:hypothetical protein
VVGSYPRYTYDELYRYPLVLMCLYNFLERHGSKVVAEPAQVPSLGKVYTKLF